METQMLYRLESDKPFDTVIDNLEKQVPEHKFRILHTHDVQKTFAEKGIERDPLKIVEVCNVGFANEALGKTMDVALFMPCRITVYPENGKTIVNLARPSMISEMLPDAGLSDLAGGVEETLKSVIQASV